MSFPRLHDSTAEADIVADCICRRRLVNAFLAIVAAWLLYGALLHSAPRMIDQRWWSVPAIGITAGAVLFAAWTVFIADGRVWTQAFYHAGKTEEDSDG